MNKLDPFGKPPIGAPAATSNKFMVDVTIETNGNVSINISRPINVIEIALTTAALIKLQIDSYAQAAQSALKRTPRDEPHKYDVNESSERSLKGYACAICGNPRAHVVHTNTVGKENGSNGETNNIN